MSWYGCIPLRYVRRPSHQLSGIFSVAVRALIPEQQSHWEALSSSRFCSQAVVAQRASRRPCRGSGSTTPRRIRAAGTGHSPPRPLRLRLRLRASMHACKETMLCLSAKRYFVSNLLSLGNGLQIGVMLKSGVRGSSIVDFGILKCGRPSFPSKPFQYFLSTNDPNEVELHSQGENPLIEHRTFRVCVIRSAMR